MKNQNRLICVFLGWKSKKLLCCGILRRHPHIFLDTKFQPKIKIFRFTTKTVSIVFSARISKTNVIFEGSTLKFANFQNFTKKQ